MSGYTDFSQLFPKFSHFYEHAVIREYDPDTYLIREDTPINTLIFGLSGSAWVFQNQANGRAYIIQVYTPGWVIGDLEYFLHSPATCNVKTTTRFKAALVPFAVVDELCRTDCETVKALAVSVAGKLRSNSFDAARNITFPLIHRFAFYLKSTDYSLVGIGKWQEVADLLGTTKRHLRRVISRMEEDGIVARTSTGLEIRDRDQIDLLCMEIDPMD